MILSIVLDKTGVREIGQACNRRLLNGGVTLATGFMHTAFQ